MFPGKHQTTRLAIFKIMPRTLMFTCSGRLYFTFTTASSRNYTLCVKQFNRFSKVSSNTFFWQGNQLSALWSSDSILHSGILTLTESLKNTEIQKEKFPPPTLHHHFIHREDSCFHHHFSSPTLLYKTADEEEEMNKFQSLKPQQQHF